MLAQSDDHEDSVIVDRANENAVEDLLKGFEGDRQFQSYDTPVSSSAERLPSSRREDRSVTVILPARAAKHASRALLAGFAGTAIVVFLLVEWMTRSTSPTSSDPQVQTGAVRALPLTSAAVSAPTSPTKK